MKKQLFIPVGFLLLYLGGFAQGMHIAAVTDKNNILLGEKFILTITASIPKGKMGAFPVIDSLAHFEIINKSKPDTAPGEKGITIEQKITLTSWDSGKWAVPAISMAKARTKPLFITVSFVPFNPQQPYHDIKEIIEVRKPPESKWWWYLAGIVFLLALFFLFFPKGNKKETPKFVSEESAYKDAIKKLAKLKAEEDNSDDKMFYTRLVEVLREYLLKRRNIQSYSATTEDLLRQMHSMDLTENLSVELVGTLRLSDLVKFASMQSSKIERKASVEIIEKTVKEIENKKDAV